MNDTEKDLSIYGDTEELTGKRNAKMGFCLVASSLLFLAAFFVCASLICHNGQSLLDMLLTPMLRYIDFL